MNYSQTSAILLPLAVGSCAILLTIFVHAVVINSTLNLVRREIRLGRIGPSFWKDLLIVSPTVALALLAHLIEIALWAVVFVMCGQFSDFKIAYYYSAGNYTTLGSGGLMMTPSWRLLGPLEAINGALMFGVSTAIIVGLIHRMIQARFKDLD